MSNLQNAGTLTDSTNMLLRLVDFLRKNRITGMFVGLSAGGQSTELTDEGLSSIVDSWLLVRDVEVGGERNRVLYVLKSRGMAHSNQLREFLITSKGIKLVPAYLGPAGVLTGSARLTQEARDAEEQRLADDDLERQRLTLEHRRKVVEAQVEALRSQFMAEEKEFARVAANARARTEQGAVERAAMARSRKVSNGSAITGV